MPNVELLVKEILNNPEDMWIEFKHNNFDPSMIGKDISALANGATLCEKDCAYFIWGIDDKTREIIGVNKKFNELKKGNEELEAWLRRMLSKNASFKYENAVIDNKQIGVLTINRAINEPVKFEGVTYIRIGSNTKRLNDYYEIEARLWNKLNNVKFEDQVALNNLSIKDPVDYMDVGKYYDLLGRSYPSTSNEIVHDFVEEGLIKRQDNGYIEITNLGALLFAKKLSNFTTVSRKAIRVVKYIGKGKQEMEREALFDKGYAIVFEEVLNYIEALLPSKEAIIDGIRKKETAYPSLAIREIVANALIHQDFSISGTGPLIEIFDNRIEVTNPGRPLVQINRIIDNPPRSRNEHLSSLMRRMKICEELGSGWDRVIVECELKKLPSPKINLYEENTKVTMFSEINFTEMSLEDKVWSCYTHACILYIEGSSLTNASLRKRFSLKETSSGSVSRLIKYVVEEEMLKPLDPTTAPRYMRYLPFWA